MRFHYKLWYRIRYRLWYRLFTNSMAQMERWWYVEPHSDRCKGLFQMIGEFGLAFHAECRGFESLRPLCGRSVWEQWVWMPSQPSVLRCMDHTCDRLPQKRKLLFSHCWARDLSNRNRARHRDLVRLVEMKHLETRSGLRRAQFESLRCAKSYESSRKKTWSSADRMKKIKPIYLFSPA